MSYLIHTTPYVHFHTKYAYVCPPVLIYIIRSTSSNRFREARQRTRFACSPTVGNYDRDDGATVRKNNGTTVMSAASAKNGVTWADIVKNGLQVKGKSQSVVSSSFSRNNPDQ